jgi:sugar phosphate isomerase/epimerase
MTLLLSLTSRSLQSLLDPSADPPRTLHDAPGYVSGELGLRGLSVDVEMLGGWSSADMDMLRHRSDQAGCPCLVLVDRTGLEFGHEDAAVRESAAERLGRLAGAATRLGCNSVSVSLSLGRNDRPTLSRAIETLQASLVAIERQELNLLLSGGPGLTDDSEGMSELIKEVGGFRIGALPTYGDPTSTEDPVEHIKRLAPYAGAIHLRCEGFKRGGGHRGLDLAAGMEAAIAVGYQSNVAIDYVGEGDPATDIAKAMEILQAVIDAE